MAHLGEGSTQWYRFFPIDKETTNFSFGVGGKDVALDAAFAVDGIVVCWLPWWGLVWIDGSIAEEVVSSRTTLAVGLAQIGGIRVDVQDHVSGGELEDGIQVSGGIVEEASDTVRCVAGGIGLFRCYGIEGHGNFSINGAAIKEKFDQDLLDAIGF